MRRARSVARSYFGTGVVLLLALGAVTLSSLPVTTKQGVNFKVSTKAIPLYMKAMSFIDRHCQYRLLAREVTQGVSSDRERAMALFEWTRQHVRPQPHELPVIDDHVLHIIIRGYGAEDQMADVFTTLLTYAGVPAFWRFVEFEGTPGCVVLSFARVDGRWVTFDVANGLVFADTQHRLIDVHELINHPELVQQTTGALAPHGIPYWKYVEQLRPFRVPGVLRAQKQMLGLRVVYEVQRVFHRVALDDLEAGIRVPANQASAR